MPHSPKLSASDLKRLDRLAKLAGSTPVQVLRMVLRDGFDQTEAQIRSVNAGLADLKAGRTVSHRDTMRRARAVIDRDARRKAA
jgi:predicted transcriptional regulator